MVHRTARNGSRAGKDFWDCCNLSKCRYTENIDLLRENEYGGGFCLYDCLDLRRIGAGFHFSIDVRIVPSWNSDGIFLRESMVVYFYAL